MSLQIKVIELKPQDALAIREIVPEAKIPSKMGQFFGELMAYFQKGGIAPAGPPFTIYHDFGGDGFDMEVGFPVARPQKGEGRVKPCVLPGGRVVTTTHIGPYEKLEATYHDMQEWMARNGLTPKKLMWEVYLSDPGKVKDPEQYVTGLYWPVE
jgi:effector-binding domain-containing protein